MPDGQYGPPPNNQYGPAYDPRNDPRYNDPRNDPRYNDPYARPFGGVVGVGGYGYDRAYLGRRGMRREDRWEMRQDRRELRHEERMMRRGPGPRGLIGLVSTIGNDLAMSGDRRDERMMQGQYRRGFGRGF